MIKCYFINLLSCWHNNLKWHKCKIAFYSVELLYFTFFNSFSFLDICSASQIYYTSTQCLPLLSLIKLMIKTFFFGFCNNEYTRVRKLFAYIVSLLSINSQMYSFTEKQKKSWNFESNNISKILRCHASQNST